MFGTQNERNVAGSGKSMRNALNSIGALAIDVAQASPDTRRPFPRKQSGIDCDGLIISGPPPSTQ